jgi:hypothetical protein
MRFSYVALNKSNQKLKGFISGDNREEAKKKLHDIGLTVLEIVEAPESNQSTENIQTNATSLPSFEFHVVDTEGRRLSGTIQASDRKNAYRRLVSEYSFIVNSLAETNIPKEQRLEEGAKGLEEIADAIEEEFGIKVQRSVEDKNKDTEDITQSILGKLFVEEKKIISEEIDEITIKTKNILKKYNEKIPAEKIDEMEVLMGNIIRLKRSNNIPLIQKVSADLCAHLEDVLDQYVLLAPVEDKEETDEQEEEKQESVVTHASHLKKVSKSLDMLLSGKRLIRKKSFIPTEDDGEAFSSVLEKKKTLRSTWKGFWGTFFKAIGSGSAIVRHQRMGEAKYFLYEFFRILKNKYEKSRQEKIKKQKEELERKEDRQSDILSLFFAEFQSFFGVLLLFFILYFLFAEIVLLKEIDSLVPFVKKSMQSGTLFFFFAVTFLGYFTATIRERFFIGEPLKTTLYLIFMGFFSLAYFINF